MLLATKGPLSEKDFANLQSFPVNRQRTFSLEITGKYDAELRRQLLLVRDKLKVPSFTKCHMSLCYMISFSLLKLLQEHERI